MAEATSQTLELSVSEVQQSLDVAMLEMAFAKSQHQVASILADERARQLRMRVLLLEDSNDNLHAQLAQDNDHIDETDRYTQDLRAQLDLAEGNVERLTSDLRMKVREVDALKAELDSLSGVTIDSTKLLTEKLGLVRELSILKPEVDHLRSMAAAQQGIFAEKLLLQRQLSTAQVELETERRATQRASAKETRLQAEDSRLEQRIESLRVEVSKERKERQKAESEARKVSSEWEGRKSVLESRLEAFRIKLRTTKEHLKQVETERQSLQVGVRKPTNNASRPTASTTAAGRNNRKRNAAQMENESIIGTPGVLAPKRGARLSTMPGDKSTFSITPFLNRTTGVATEEPLEEGDSNGSDRGDAQSGPLSADRRDVVASTFTMPQGVKPTKSNPSAGDPTVVLPRKAGKTDVKGPRARKVKVGPMLEEVAEEHHDENATNRKSPGAECRTEVPADITINKRMDVIKKKRKLLGGGLVKTLFDEDDPESTKGSQREILGGARNFGSLGIGKAVFGGLKGSIRTGTIASTSGFGTISPLKKDKKAVAG